MPRLTKIKQDSVSVYVRCNGAIYRPIPAKLTYVWDDGTERLSITKGPHVIDGAWRYVIGRTKWKVGEEAHVKNINYTPYCNVEGELWTTHGADFYFDGNNKRIKVPTDECFSNGQVYVPRGAQ